jgi:hypothetical protein
LFHIKLLQCERAAHETRDDDGLAGVNHDFDESCALRPGSVHSADGWGDVLGPVVAGYQGKVSRVYFRAGAGFANLMSMSIRKASGSSMRSDFRPTGSWTKPRRVIAKVEWHPGELYPRVGFIVTNLSRPAERVGAFDDKRGTCSGVRRPMVMRQTATDGRSASKCQRKRPDQPLDHRSGCPS